MGEIMEITFSEITERGIVEVRFKELLIGTIEKYEGLYSTMWRAELSNSDFIKGKANYLVFKNKDLEQCKKDILNDIDLIKNVFGLKDNG